MNGANLGNPGPVNFVNGTFLTASNPSAGQVKFDITSLPAPTASALGGVEALTCAANTWLSQISTGGIPSCSQPGFSNLSGSLASSQLPSGWNPVSIPNGGTGQVTPGAAFNALSPLNTVVAATQSGSDCGAKINTGDSSLGATAGEIWVNQGCGTTWTTALALSANHVLRFIQGGTYTLNVGQTISAANVGIVGDGPWTTVLSVNFAAGDVFNFTGSGGYVRDVRFVAAVARTAGAYVHFNGIMPGLIQNYSTDGAFIGVQVTNSSTVRIQSGRMMNGATTSGAAEISLDGSGGQNDIYIEGVTMDAPVGSQPPAGIQVLNSGATNITNVDIIHHGTDLSVAPGNGQAVASLYVLDSYFDTAVNGIVIDPSGTGAVNRLRFVGSWTSSHTNQGFVLNNLGSGACSVIQIIGHHALLNANQGLYDQAGCTDVQVIGGLYASNSDNGISVGAGVGSFQIEGVRATANSQRGILVNAGASDNYQIIGNDLRGNTGAALLDSGTGLNKVLSGNLPVTANSLHPLGGVAFASLPAAANGALIFCTDCNATCTAASSTGRTCFRENGAWTH